MKGDAQVIDHDFKPEAEWIGKLHSLASRPRLADMLRVAAEDSVHLV